MDTVDLALRMTADASDATSALDSVGDAAGRMAADVDDATRKADDASSRFDSVGESADEMASKSSQAAGGLGDLGGALALMPGPLGAVGAGMEAVAPAIMGVTGASDLLNLVTESNIVLQARQKAASIASAVTSKAQAAATMVAAGAQRALNFAMAASPLGAVILLVVALVAGVVLAYKKSETFRRIVDKAMSAVRSAVGKVVDILAKVGSWVKDKLPDYFRLLVKVATIQYRLLWMAGKFAVDKIVDAFNWVKDKAAAVFKAVKDAAGGAWDWVVDKVRKVVDIYRDRLAAARGLVVSLADKVRSALGGAWDWVMDKVQPIVDAVEWIIDKLGSIDLPDLPGFGFGRAVSAAPTDTTTTGTTTVTEYVTINVSGVLSESEAGETIVGLLNRRARRRGQPPVVVA